MNHFSFTGESLGQSTGGKPVKGKWIITCQPLMPSNLGQGGTASEQPKTTKEAAGHEETDSGKYIVHCY